MLRLVLYFGGLLVYQGLLCKRDCKQMLFCVISLYLRIHNAAQSFDRLALRAAQTRRIREIAHTELVQPPLKIFALTCLKQCHHEASGTGRLHVTDSV